MTKKCYALLSSGDLVDFGAFDSFSQAWLEEPSDAVFILDDQGLEKLRRQSTELLDQDQDQDQYLDLVLVQALFQTLSTPLNYRKLEAELLPHLVTEVTVEGWTIGINMPELRGSFERDRDGLGGSLTFQSVMVGDPETGNLRKGLELVDYDGGFALPRPVFNQLKVWGVIMDETFDPDYEVQP